ncbi:MAG: four helix bundle protein [Clostridia bacterium]|nr:four helix bundle protein [Clostridia bacterium]
MNNELILIPKFKTYMKYILKMLIKLPRTEKYSIGTEYKTCVYETLEDIMMLSKIGKEEKIKYINRIDARLNTQRILLRIMQEEHWIDNKKFEQSMLLIGEIGKILGGLLKFYGKNIKK